MERLLARFRSAHTQVLGVSVDSVFCHANWGQSLGGISFPLLADFHPKGAMATGYGLFLSDNGITDRATVVIDLSGTLTITSHLRICSGATQKPSLSPGAKTLESVLM